MYQSPPSLAHRIGTMLVGVVLGTIVASHVAWSADPNVIVIYTDDQGYGDVSSYNDDAKFATPNLDRLAAEGMIFTDAHSSDTVCTPSRYGLLTGRYSWRTTLKRGVYGAEKECLIADGRVTVASFLRDQGYQTGMVGKWHLGMDFPGDRRNRDWTKPVADMPLDKGFDYFWGIPASMNYGVLAWFDGRYAKVPPTLYTSKKPNAIAIDDYRIQPPYDRRLRNAGTTNELGVVKGALEVAPDFVDSECLTRFTDKAIEWIESRGEATDSVAPFFLYLPYTSPHKPVIPIDRFRGKSSAGAYGDFMMETDWHIGRILETLDRRNLAENTLVIVTSDNGPETTWKKRIAKYGHASNEKYREGKRSIYEGGHRVPFLVRWPARVTAGTRCDKPICQTDLLATFAELLAKELPDSAGEDSDSFFGHLLGQDSVPARSPIIHHSSGGGFAIRDGEWKLVMEHRKQRKELYDLSTDPGEAHDLLADHPDVAKRMEERLEAIVRDGRSTPGATQRNDTGWWADLTWMDPW